LLVLFILARPASKYSLFHQCILCCVSGAWWSNHVHIRPFPCSKSSQCHYRLSTR
jgi:hypothetical protein